MTNKCNSCNQTEVALALLKKTDIINGKCPKGIFYYYCHVVMELETMGLLKERDYCDGD